LTILYYHVKFLHPAWEQQTELFMKVYNNAQLVYNDDSLMMAKQKAVYCVMVNRLTLDNLTPQGFTELAKLSGDLI